MAKKDKGGIPTPNVINPPESMQVTLCIPKNVDHMKAFYGALWELTMWNSWQPDAAHTGKELAAVWYRYWLSWDRTMSEIECEDDMGYCCVDRPKLNRIDPDTGRPVVSYDGGETWQPSADDPQFAVIQLPPAVTSGVSNTKCDAATNALGNIQDIIAETSSNIATAGSVYELAVIIAGAILAAAVMALSGGALSPVAVAITGIIWGAGTAAFEMGQAAFDDYWSSEVLDLMLCALYNNIGEDGAFTEAQYQGWRSEFKFEAPSSPARDIVMTAINAVGAAGLSNMAANGAAATSDCSDCEEPTCLTSYEIYCGVGSILSVEEDHLIVQCGTSSITGGFGIALTTNNPEVGCYVTKVINVSTGLEIAPLSAYRVMGESVPECGGSFGHANVYCLRTHTFVLYDLTNGQQLEIYLSEEPCP